MVRTNGRLMWTIDTKRQKTRTFQPKTDGAFKVSEVIVFCLAVICISEFDLVCSIFDKYFKVPNMNSDLLNPDQWRI